MIDKEIKKWVIKQILGLLTTINYVGKQNKNAPNYFNIL